MQRTLEPELMEDERQALAYASADFSTSNQWYVDHLLQDYPGHCEAQHDIAWPAADVEHPAQLPRIVLQQMIDIPLVRC
jgi:hypothetical protein